MGSYLADMQQEIKDSILEENRNLKKSIVELTKEFESVLQTRCSHSDYYEYLCSANELIRQARNLTTN